jgi:hypothetical protein
MPRPEGISEEEWENMLDRKYQENCRESLRERIRKEGFETTAWDPDPGETCIRSKTKKLSPRRKVIEPCGEPAMIGFRLRTPEHPDGIHLPLCRSCFVAELKHLLSYLD